jgi:Protein of unknown function (DUF3551)
MRTLITSSSLLAALIAASSAAQAQGSPVCLKGISGIANCVYQTMGQCEAAKGMNAAAQCVPRVDANSGLTPAQTTGQGSSGQATPPTSPLPRPSPQR